MKTNEHSKAFKAMKHLNELGFDIEIVDGKYVYKHYAPLKDEILSERDIIKLAKVYSNEGQRTPAKANTKEFRHRNNRAQTRQDIHNENFDSFFQKKLRRDENIWNWD